MPVQQPTVFICSATGSQGGALARQLRDLDWNVHATTRNTNSAEARRLQSIGVELTQGDWDDSEALRRGLAGCDKLFLCLLPNFVDMSSEHRQAERILQLARESGVKQVVASSSLGVSQLEAGSHVVTGSFMEKHLMSKRSIEQAVTQAGFDFYTFIRPGFFMANFIEPKVARYPEIRDKGTWTTSMAADTLLPLVDHTDIAKLATASMQDPRRLDRQSIGLASELLTIQQTLDELANALERPGAFQAIFMTDKEIKAQGSSNVLINSTTTMRSMSQYVNMKELAEIIPLTTFKEFLEREKEGVKQTYN